MNAKSSFNFAKIPCGQMILNSSPSSTQGSDHTSWGNLSSDEEKSKCPFSMNFPRYQIQLTRGKEPRDKNKNISVKKNQKESKNKFSLPFVTRVSNSLNKNILMQTTYKQDALDGNFLWRECNDEAISKNSAKNIHSVATFWQVVSEFQLELDSSNNQLNSNHRKILVLPDSSFQTVRGLIEILDWHNEQFIGFDQDRENEQNFIHASLDKEASIPIIIFSQKRTEKNNSKYNMKKKYNYDSLSKSSYDSILIRSRIQSWVKRILVDHSICPFTKSIHRSGQGLSDLGVPVGRISYPTSSSNPTSILLLMADTWTSILEMMAAGPSGKQGISSILLAAPGFDNDFELWAGPIFCMLEACVSACQGEQQVGLVCFHPEYKTPDGTSWPGFGHMHSVPRLLKWVNEFKGELDDDKIWNEEEASAGGAWQRRTPHSVINVLRSDQLEVAEGRRQTGILYSRNIRVLVGEVGLNRLEQDLENERNMQ